MCLFKSEDDANETSPFLHLCGRSPVCFNMYAFKLEGTVNVATYSLYILYIYTCVVAPVNVSTCVTLTYEQMQMKRKKYYTCVVVS